ncbi:MAG: SMP-30/gluconolactonase/LRE family protein [Pseudomonadota bacterium]
MFKRLVSIALVGTMIGCAAPEPPSDQAAPTPDANSAAHAASGNADERAALAAGSTLPQPVNVVDLLSCETIGGMTPHCGYKNPEDLVHIPDTDLLIVSEMGEFMADSPGTLSLLNTATGKRETLSIDWTGAAESWGERDCPAPQSAAFSPHGIDLVRRETGDLSLLVVNHGGRESIEFFAVSPTGDLAWRGCAMPPGDPFLNDVAARQDGGFYVTHMWNKSGKFDEIVANLLGGVATGWVWAWTAEGGFVQLPQTNDLMPNGIAIDAEDKTLYVNLYFGNKTFAFDLSTNTRGPEAELRQPDNVSVDPDGTLWIASHQHDAIQQACTGVTQGPCLLPFQVVTINPDTFESKSVLDHAGSPMGYATVALKVGNRIYLGTAHGDRVVSIEL